MASLPKQIPIILAIFVSLVAASETLHAQTKVPQFKDYPAIEKFNGKNAPPRLITRTDKMYRTMLREGATGKPNFAGHFIVATWGCGTQCIMGAVIDANTGNVYWLPHSTCCWDQIDDNFEPIEFRLNSRLIIFSGLRDEDGDNGAHFYEFKEGKFIHIKSILKREQ